MRFEKIAIHNLGPFKDVELDFAAINGKLIAVTGANGEGKSTLLELLPAALYRQCPTRGSLVELATARDAMLEVHARNGRPYVIRQTADPVSKRSEALILHDGVPVVESGKVRDADAWMAAHFPRPEVFFASTFLAQQSEGFLELARTERSRVLLRLLGIERYEAMAEAAREHARQCRAQLATAEARLADVRRLYPGVGETEERHARALERIEAAQGELEEARGRLDHAKGLQSRLERAHERLAQRAAVQQRITALDQQIVELEERIKNNRMLVKRRPEIDQAARELAQLQERDQAAAQRYSEADIAYTQASERRVGAEGKLEQLTRALSRAQERVEELRERLQDATKVAKAVEALPRLRKVEADASAHVTALEGQSEGLQNVLHQAKDTRIDGLREGLESIRAAGPTGKTRGGGKANHLIAGETLDADDALVASAATAPELLSDIRQQLTAAKLVHEKARNQLQTAERVASRAPDIAKAKQQLVSAEAALEETQQQVRAATAELDKLKPTARAAGMERQRIYEEREGLAREIAARERDAALAPKCAIAAARLEELQPELGRAAATRAQHAAELGGLPAIDVEPVDLNQAVAAVTASETGLVELQRQAALASEAVKRAHEGVQEIDARALEVNDCQSRLQDWTRLGQDLGKDGLQALEIDAAIPELNTLTNDLLHSCHGSRFTVNVHTDRLSADGKKTLEDLEVRVLDTEHGRDALAETYSGGERVIVGEALSLALTMLACRRAGLSHPTLVRDESGAALDPINGRAYIAMLRRAAEILDADKVLFVTHSRELQELADARIEVGHGTALVLQ